ncbi:hypothetical protein EJB05_13653, partial [Eragrostis curvula]
MGFNPPVPQNDSDWEIRVVVLLSLLLQIFLIFVGPMRKRTSHPFPRFLVWSCYLLADWVADLALGLLLNNMGNIGGGGGDSNSTAGNNSGGGPIIFAFWTPFLLLHLGGPDTITAYSLEDNELWLRHLIGLFFELFSALVIFGCSLNGNPMIPTTVLMHPGKHHGRPNPGPNYAKLMTEFDAKKNAGLAVEISIASDNDLEPRRAAQEAASGEREETTTRLALQTNKSAEARAHDLFLIFRRLFVNLMISHKERRLSQALFLHRFDPGEAYETIELELNFAYDMVYTKAPVAHTRAGWVLRSICSACLVTSLVIFFLLHKAQHGISRVDVGITYVLLLGGLALDAAALVMLLFSDHVKVQLENSSHPWLLWLQETLTRMVPRPRRWAMMTWQLNLIRYCVGKPDHYRTRGWRRLLNKFAKSLRVEGIIDDFFFIRHRLITPLTTKDDGPRRHGLLDFIFDGLKEDAEKLQDKGMEEIKKACDRRGTHFLQIHEKEITDALGENTDERKKKWDLILGSVSMGKTEFDKSVLLWHIATDLCLFKDRQGPLLKETARMRDISEMLSEYMLYLLIKQPEMLSATGSIGQLYRDTCADARRFFGSIQWRLSEDEARRMLLAVNTSGNPADVKGHRSKSVLFDAVILAKALRSLCDDHLMWAVGAGVWREMLTFAAGKCQGSTHLRQLNSGGELITLVWFLKAHMGLSDMYQEEDAKAKLLVDHDDQ